MSQFGGPPREDDYGFFGPTKPSASASQFGTLPAPPASGTSPVGGNPSFGAPAPVGFGSPPIPTYAAPASPSRPGARTILGVLGVGILVLVGGWFGWAAYQTSKAVVIPSTLGGRPLIQDPSTAALADEALSDIRADNPGLKVEAGIYGTEADLAVLMVARGRLDVDGEWSDIGVTSRSTYGKNQCAALPGQQISVCIRTSRTLGVETVLIGGTLEQASAALDEAWRAQ